MKNILTTEITDLSKYQIIDVRTKEEFSESHIPNSQNIPVENLIDEQIPNLKKDMPLLVYCETGARSLVACQILDQHNYKTHNLVGGLTAWNHKKPS